MSRKRVHLIVFSIFLGLTLLLVTMNVATKAGEIVNQQLRFSSERSFVRNSSQAHSKIPDTIETTEIILQPGPADGMDTQIDQSYPDTPAGDLDRLTIGTRNPDEYPGGPYRILLKFDLSSLPSNAGIDSAILEAYIQAYQGPNTFQFFQATSAWDEDTTWNTQPTYAFTKIWGTLSSDEEGVWVTRTVDLTEIFRAWQAGSIPNHGFYIKGEHEEKWTRHWFWSSDQVEEIYRPKLTINYHPQNKLSVSLEDNGKGRVYSEPAGIDCDKRSTLYCKEMFDPGTVILLKAVPAPGSVFTGWGGACSGTGDCVVTMDEDTHVSAGFFTTSPEIILQPGPADGMDTLIDQSYPDTPGGDLDRLIIGTRNPDEYPGGPYRILLKFDLSSLPPDAGIDSAILEAYIQAYQGPNTFQFFRATSDWDENSTWNTQPGFAMDTIWGTFSSSEEGIWVTRTVDLTPIFRGWQSGAIPNYGFYIKGEHEEEWTRHWFWSSDQEEEDYRPKVIIDYHPQNKLSVSLEDRGKGWVTSEPAGIECGKRSTIYCKEMYDPGTVITLQAFPEPYSEFIGWGGACTGTGDCVVTMDDDKQVSAAFFTKNTEIVLQPGPADGMDTQIDQSYPDTSGWDLDRLIIGTRNPDEYPGGPYRILLKFDLSSIPQEEGIVSAILEAYIQAYQGPNTFQFFRATSGWDEDTTWNTQPTYASDTIWGTFSSDEEGEWVTRTVDLTEIFRAWQAGSVPNYGFYIKGEHEEKWTRHWFWSSDQVEEIYRPKLTIIHRPQNKLSVSLAGTGVGLVSSIPEGIRCNSPGEVNCTEMYEPGTVVTLTADPLMGSNFGGWEGDCNGKDDCVLTLTEDKSVTAIFIPGESEIIIEPGPEEGMDTFVDEAFPDATHGNDSYLMIGRSIRDADPGGPFRSLLKFDLPTLPPGATIENAVLDLNIQNFETSNTFLIYRATSTWNEETTWNTIPSYDSSKVWGFISSDQGQIWVQESIDLTTLVRGWYDGTYPNYGLYIKGAVESFRTRQFLASSDHPTIEYRPRLQINFAAQYGLTVSLFGDGDGVVTSQPTGINCGTTGSSDCYELLNFGETITLTANPAEGSVFTGWEGICTGTGDCTVLMYDQQAVTARFEPEVVEWKVYVPLIMK